jgi:hypothetical protein
MHERSFIPAAIIGSSDSPICAEANLWRLFHFSNTFIAVLLLAFHSRQMVTATIVPSPA